MSPEEARKQLHWMASTVSPVEGKTLLEAAVDAVLSDVPLLMQAIGAEREKGKVALRHNLSGSPIGDGERWITPWKEADDG